MTNFAEDYNKVPFDWCYDCADVVCNTSVKKMFAWIIISTLKNDNWSYYFYDAKTADEKFRFEINLSVLQKNVAIATELYKKENWEFMKEMVYNHLIMNTCENLIITKEVVQEMNNPQINITDNSVILEYDFKV